MDCLTLPTATFRALHVFFFFLHGVRTVLSPEHRVEPTLAARLLQPWRENVGKKPACTTGGCAALHPSPGGHGPLAALPLAAVMVES